MSFVSVWLNWPTNFFSDLNFEDWQVHAVSIVIAKVQDEEELTAKRAPNENNKNVNLRKRKFPAKLYNYKKVASSTKYVEAHRSRPVVDLVEC